MATFIDPILDVISGLIAWVDVATGQSAESFCMLETANDRTTLVARDGSLVSIIKCSGVTFLVGPEEFTRIHTGVTQTFRTSLSRPGHALQLYFCHDKDPIKLDLSQILSPAKQTAQRLGLALDDLFSERIDFLANYCATEAMYFVLWTRTSVLTETMFKQAVNQKMSDAKKAKVPTTLPNAQNLVAALPEMRDAHQTYVKTTLSDLNDIGLHSTLLDIHEACHAIRNSVDTEFTDEKWRASLPGDKLPLRESKNFKDDVSNIMWPPLASQLIPRDGENIDLRTARIGDRIYGSVFVELFPQEVQPFVQLFRRILPTGVPWRISFIVESGGMTTLGLKPTLAAILSFASNNNRLLSNSAELLKYIQNNTDEAIVALKVTATTWANYTEDRLLKSRVSELSKAIQGWGYIDTTEVSGDAYQGVISSALAITLQSVARTSVAPLSEVTYMFPLTRPASPWSTGAVLFRSPDGKPWPYQPGSTLQTTWIDLIYARPGSGKSVLSNSINLALCLSAGIQRLPRIAIIDIGPSSSGLISLIQEALPQNKRHLAAYHRLRMTKDMSINPFDTQLGSRYPSPQDRAFLVNFLTLLATPVGETTTYDGISDMAGLIVDELYKNLADGAHPNPYSAGLNPEIDLKLAEHKISVDVHTSWWEITDALFAAGDIVTASVAHRYAMPLLSDAASIARTKPIEDLYGAIIAPTGENIISAFGRMISNAIREYPILSQITTFDLGNARIVSLDLDEVAKTGGEAADRQTAIMYMLARYILARHYYLIEESIGHVPQLYLEYHQKRVKEISEDPKRIVYDEFHRTARAQAVRDQVLVDMREGRKWNVHVALLSQSLDDFDPTMIEFATSIFIMDAGPKQAVEKSTKVFGLSETARLALETRVHGPRAGGATLLAQFATKEGTNTQLITSTIGPIELWAFNTTSVDAKIRNGLYKRIGAGMARKVLATLYPAGSAAKVVEDRLSHVKTVDGLISEEKTNSIIDQIIEETVEIFHKDPRFNTTA
ncbi:MAG TPA: type IV secretion protein IcmB [Gammaproteobacteria bacterium]|nr:type IV secretion protein IcmB [Gammaproteobacteria bacterium]